MLALASALAPKECAAQVPQSDLLPIKNRNIEVSRAGATQLPRSEGDQSIVDGWPLYRTERGQAAFNDVMAALKVTRTTAPNPAAFQGCERLECGVSLPALTQDGWIPPGRIWVSPSEYILVVHSPRLRDGQSYRRRAVRE